MGEVVFDGKGEVTSDGSGGCFEGVGGTHHGSDGFNRVVTLYGDGNDWSAREVVHDAVEERSLFVFRIVSFDGFARGVQEFKTDNLQVSSLNSSGDLPDEVALNSAWLDEYECSFHFGCASLPGASQLET